MNINEVNCRAYQHHVQPCDIYSLILDPDGIKMVDWYQKDIIPKSLRDPNTDRVVRDWIDYKGYIGPEGKAWTTHQLKDNFNRWSRGSIDLPITKEQCDHMVEEARKNNVYFYGDWHPWKPNTPYYDEELISAADAKLWFQLTDKQLAKLPAKLKDGKKYRKWALKEYMENK